MPAADNHAATKGAKRTNCFSCVVFFVAFVVFPAFAQTYRAPRTPWGDPDLQGVWPSTEFAGVPLERAPQFGTRNRLTDVEMLGRELQQRNQRDWQRREGTSEWLEWGRTQRQASLIVDPPDGRLPAMTPAAKARASRQPAGTAGVGPFDGPHDFTMWERCISRGVLGSTLPVLYNSGIDITQAPGVVAIRYEMIHDHRIIRLTDAPLLPAAIQQYMGDARGHWDRDTLVVETRNFNGRTGPSSEVTNTPGMVLTERFRRVSDDTLQYQATVRDPGTWAAPWTVSFPLRLGRDYQMYEYACHEGNYALRNALSAARAGDQ